MYSDKKLVVFDLDGTLNRTELYSVKAQQMALKETGGKKLSDEFLKSQFGSRPDDYIKLFFDNPSPETRKKFFELVAKYENELILKYGKSFDGSEEALNKLKQNGYLIGVCSNSSERYIRMVLSVLKLIDYVDFIQPLIKGLTKNESLGALLEKVKPKSALMVGDRIYDKKAAESNSISFIGCLYGFNDREVADADKTVTKPSEIFDAVKELLG